MKAVVVTMDWLVLLHVLAAVIGLGPAYAFPFLLRNTSSAKEMESVLGQVSRLELFPKVAGTIAVISGLVLFWVGSYGPFLQIWIAGTLMLYVIIEILIIGFLNPAVKKLHAAIAASETELGAQELPPHIVSMYARVRNIHLWASLLSIVIFILMILKPQ